MNQIKKYTIIGTIFVLITGTLCHFFYSWSGNNFFIGLFCPINESTWEHMKLVFFPSLLYCAFLYLKFRKSDQKIYIALTRGILTGTFLIPVLFYTYTGVLGNNFFILDILVFIISVITGFYCFFRFQKSFKMQKHGLLYLLLLLIVFICFLIFSVFPPDIGLFIPPE